MIDIAGRIYRRRIIDFLKTPGVDNSFVKPLSQRDLSITQRVDKYYREGTWIIGHKSENIRGCVAVRQNADAAYLSTFALVHKPSLNDLKLGLGLLDYVIQYASIELKAKVIDTDSWENNSVVEKLLLRKGFKINARYDDPAKRPPGVQTVYYVKEVR
jgi:hypothetical protein